MKEKLSWQQGVLVMFAVLCMVMVGCTLKRGDESIRHMTREDLSEQIIIGKTTKDDMLAQFGEPTTTVAGNDGKDEWRYIYAEKEFSALHFLPYSEFLIEDPKAKGKMLKVTFNARGIVSNFTVEDTTEQDAAHWDVAD